MSIGVRCSRTPSRRREDRQEAYESREETEVDEEEANEEGDRDKDTPRGAPVEVIRVGGRLSPSEENADLPDFTPECAHLLLWEVYGDLLHHNDGLQLDRRVADDAIWQRRWIQLAEQSDSWYATPSGAVGRRFTAILAAEWRGFLPGVGDLRYPSSSPTSFLQIFLASVGQRRSVPG